MGRGILTAMLSGAGNSLAQSEDENQKFANEQALMRERADLEEQKQLSIDAAKRARDRAAGLAQGSAISAGVQTAKNASDAAAINSSQGSTMSPEDAAVLRNNPAARAAYGLPAETRQSDLEARGNTAENLGYLDAARETRGELQTEIQNSRNEANDKSTNRRLDQQEQDAKDLREYNMRREDRLDRLAESTLAYQKAQSGKESARADQMAAREQRAATNQALLGANADIKSLEKDLADPMLAPEKAAVIKGQLDSTRAEAQRYRKLLAGVGIETAPATPEAAPTPTAATIQKLKANPDQASDFDKMFGKGASSKYLQTAAPSRASDASPQPVERVSLPAAASTGQTSRNPIDTRDVTIARGKTKQQWGNRQTGQWYDSQAEAIASLQK